MERSVRWRRGKQRFFRGVSRLAVGICLAGALTMPFGEGAFERNKGELPEVSLSEGTAFLDSRKVQEKASYASARASSEDFTLYSQSAVLMDADTGRILYEKDGEKKRPMASTTKIMTCILALEEGNPEDLAEISSYAASMPDVQLGIREGEQYRLKDLLYSLMLESHNDSAVAVAEHIAGSVEGFAEMMNQKARDIGCSDTCFVTPNGLDGVRKQDGTPHSTTASDLAKIMAYCVSRSPKREEFIELTRTASHSFTDIEKKRSFYCSNHNAFLTMMPEALTGKTGFTGGAGYCYIGAVQDGDRTFIVSLLGCGWPPHKTWKWSDMKKLASYGLSKYQLREVFEDRTFPDIPVECGVNEKVSLDLSVPLEERTLKILMKEGEEAEIRCRCEKQLEAPVKEGTPVGSVDYYVGGTLIQSYPICTIESVERISYLYCLRQCLQKALSF